MEPLPDRLPLIIGVTGHRDLRDQDVPRLEQEVAAIIAGLRRDYLGDDVDTPIVVLSALAEGADRLVARVALKQGARLIAPLPMPVEEYRRDFDPGQKPGSLAEFEGLLAQAVAAPVMRWPDAASEGLHIDQEQRNEQYRKLGVFITRHCHVLLALWDGDDKAMSPGGTAEVVKFKRSGIPLDVGGSPRVSLDASEIGPVIEIITPRMKETSAVDQVSVRPWGQALFTGYRGGIARRARQSAGAFCGRILRREVDDERTMTPAMRRELETWEHFEALINLTRGFNRDGMRLTKTLNGPAQLAQSLNYLFTDGDNAKAEADAKRRATELAPLWCRLYAIADSLASERQSRFKWDWKCLIGLGFVAFLCFAIFSHVGYIWNAIFLMAYVLTFAAGVFVYLDAVRRRDQERYLDYRALAEALRIAVYWTVLGIGRCRFGAQSDISLDQSGENSVGMIADAYPISETGELAWVKVCLRTIACLVQSDGGTPDRIDPADHAIARRFWVQGQLAYFKRQSYHHNGIAESIKAWSNFLLVAPTSVLVPILIYLMLRQIEVDWYGVDVQFVILAILGLLAGVAALLTSYSERLALAEQARQYDRMRMLFRRACDLLPLELDDNTFPLARALYHELGIEAMKENAEWVAIYRQRPIKPPH